MASLPSHRSSLGDQEAKLLQLGSDDEQHTVSVAPFGGRKLRTRQTIGGEREPEGGDQELLRALKLKRNLEKFKGYKPGQENVMFVDTCEKVNDKIKHQTRVVVVTTEAIYNVEPGSFKVKRSMRAPTDTSHPKAWLSQVKRRIDLRSVDEISVSCLDDDYLCMHIPSEYRSGAP